MALVLDRAALASPLSADEPCGPDLEAEGDLDFLNDLAHAEALLPASFFSRDDEGRLQPFDRSGIDFGRENKALLAVLARTRDIRVLVLLARLAMLDRDLPGFVATLTGIADLLEAYWEEVHPRGEEGDFDLRNAILQALEDVPTVILPLQHIVLTQSRRYGPLCFRNVMIADGEVPAPDGESVPDRASIERALEEAEPEATVARLEAFRAILAAGERIHAVTVARAGHSGAVDLERLKGLSGRIRDLLSASRRETAAPSEQGETASESAAPAPRASSPTEGLATVAQASAALAAAGAYLRTHEPSSPAELLVRQAQMLVGMSFLDVMRTLVPANAADAIIAFGANRSLRVTFDQLSAVPMEDLQRDDEDEREDMDDREDSDDREDEAGGASGNDAPVSRAPARNRAEAMTLIREVSAFFRSREPSSPIPLILEKATGLADRDFLAILRDVLPDLNTP